MRTLVLWDIDHTLIAVGGLSREIYGKAFRQVTGRQMERLADMAGRTDRAIVSETLLMHDITPTDQVIHAIADALATGFADRSGEINARGRVLPGARAALTALAERPDVLQSVLTGNMAQIAAHKLTAFDLQSFVDLEIGAYGLDAADRPPLVTLARQRATAKHGEPFDADTTVLVGDTPRDIDAAHRGGARVVAVATGASTEQTLRTAGATQVLKDLTDTQAVLQAILPA